MANSLNLAKMAKTVESKLSIIPKKYIVSHQIQSNKSIKSTNSNELNFDNMTLQAIANTNPTLYQFRRIFFNRKETDKINNNNIIISCIIAISLDRDDLLMFLLSNSQIDINRNIGSGTLLYIAIDLRAIKCITILVQVFQANVNIIGIDRKSMIQCAVILDLLKYNESERNKLIEMSKSFIKILINYGCNTDYVWCKCNLPNPSCPKCDTLIDYVSQCDHLEYRNWLIEILKKKIKKI
jgi:hypothetical protein